MRKLIVLEFMTLDGVIQGPGGPDEDTSDGFTYGGWIVPYADDVTSQAMGEQMRPPFELLLGRKTYEIWAPYWPLHEEGWPGINDAKKYVASDTLTAHEWRNTIFLGGDIPAHVRRLKQQDGPDLKVYGSGVLVQTLLRHDLVDGLWLKIYPITLGKGKRLFAEGTMPAAFELMDAKASPSGVIVKTGSFD
jgi:dihydrofolate reductase